MKRLLYIILFLNFCFTYFSCLSTYEAYEEVDEGIVLSHSHFRVDNSIIYDTIYSLIKNDSVANQEYKIAIDSLKIRTDSLINYINNLKVEIVVKVDVISKDEAKVKINNLHLFYGKDNYDIPTRYMCGFDVKGQTGEANKLKLKLEEYKTYMLEVLNDSTINIANKESVVDSCVSTQFGIKTALTEEEKQILDESSQNWEMANFYHLAAVACITNLSKIQSDVYNAESMFLEIIINQLISTKK